jgi:hypothetical protein
MGGFISCAFSKVHRCTLEPNDHPNDRCLIIQLLNTLCTFGFRILNSYINFDSLKSSPSLQVTWDNHIISYVTKFSDWVHVSDHFDGIESTYRIHWIHIVPILRWALLQLYNVQTLVTLYKREVTTTLYKREVVTKLYKREIVSRMIIMFRC